jgi:hypothetical protein
MSIDKAAGIRVYLELGAKRVFAAALDWPGWCRSGKSEAQALAALAAVTPRYATVASEAGLALPDESEDAFHVVERLPGTATTEFGAPDRVTVSDLEPLDAHEAERLASLVAAAWVVFDRIVAGAPTELRKGPRGGGRDRDEVVQHVLGAETMYARKLGIRQREPTVGDDAAIATLRDAIVERERDARDPAPLVERGWPPRYAARRIAWHVLDHAWEIEDRSG